MDSQAAEPEEDETSLKCYAATNTTSDAGSVSPFREVQETRGSAKSSTCPEDLLHSPMQCSDSHEQCTVLATKNVTDAGSFSESKTCATAALPYPTDIVGKLDKLEISRNVREFQDNTDLSLISYAESPCTEFHYSSEVCGSVTSTTYHLNLFPKGCTSYSQEQRVVPSSDNVVDLASSNEPRAAASPILITPVAELDKPKISGNSFDVYFQNVPPEKTLDPLALTDEAYKQMEVDEINKAKEMIKSKFTDYTADLLRDSGFTEDECKWLADLVMNGEKVKINADGDPIEYIYEYYRHYKDVQSYQCLRISAPEIGSENDPDEDKQEMQNFCVQAFPLDSDKQEPYNKADLDKMITWREVSSCDQVRKFICDFFRRSDGIRATNALHAIIVLFGHVSGQGFRVGGQHMSLDEITWLVRNEFDEALSQYPPELPVKVEVIFRQSFSHLCDQRVQSNRFRVTAFTTKVDPATISMHNEKVRFYNTELQQYARGLNLRQQFSEVDAWRCSDNDATSSTCDLDLCMEQCALTYSNNDANLQSSNEPGEESTAAAAAPSLVATAAELDIPEMSDSDVYFPQALTIEDYRQWEVDEINRLEKMIKSEFTDYTADLLKNIGFTEDESKELADRVMNGKKVKSNAEEDPLEDIYKYYRYWKDIQSYQCLLISAPEIGEKNDSEARKCEMQNFCVKAFPVQVDGKTYFNAKRLDRVITWEEVDNRDQENTSITEKVMTKVKVLFGLQVPLCDQVKRFIRNFFHRSEGIRAKNALHAIIVFFGHGSEQGFRVGNQDMPLDEIVSLVKDEWSAAVSRWPRELPVTVEIIFPQCFGYLYDHCVQTDRFKVTALTTANYFRTLTVPNAEGRPQNCRLRRYAEGPLQEEFIPATGSVTLQQQVIERENWRRSDNDASVDSGLTRKDIKGMSPTTPASATADPVVERQYTYSDL